MGGRGKACVHVKHRDHADGAGMKVVLCFWKDMSCHQGVGGNTAVLGLSSAKIFGSAAGPCSTWPLLVAGNSGVACGGLAGGEGEAAGWEPREVRPTVESA